MSKIHKHIQTPSCTGHSKCST